MTLEECVEALEAQIDAASGLGFGVIRLHVGVPVPAIEQALPAAERTGVVLATEFQGPKRPTSRRSRRCSSSASASAGLHRSRSSSISASRCGRYRRRSPTRSAPPAWRAATSIGSSSCGATAGLCVSSSLRSRKQAPPASPKTRRARGSCVSADRIPPPGRRSCHWLRTRTRSSGRSTRRVTIRRPTTARSSTLLAGSSPGVVTSEWGGSAWVDGDDVDGFAIVAQHQRLLSRLSKGRRRARRRESGRTRRVLQNRTQGGRRGDR